MNDIKILIHKIRNANIDVQAMINSSVLFVIAWLIVFWVFQIFTILPAFSIGQGMVVYNSFIDFNTIGNTELNAGLLSFENNVYNIFFTPLLLIVILVFVALLFLIKWNTDRLNIRRLLFWIIVCSIIRVGGNLIFGLCFNLFSLNLITDAIGLTYPMVWGRYLIILLSLIIVSCLFIMMSHEIKFLFNPYIKDRFSNLSSNIFLPSLIGCVILTIWNVPSFYKNEIWSLILMMLMITVFMCYPFIRKYRGVYQETNKENTKEKINIFPIVILGILFIGNVLLMKGINVKNDSYNYFFVENIVMLLAIITLLLTLLISVRVYNHRQNKEKQLLQERSDEILAIQKRFQLLKNMNTTQKNLNAGDNNKDELRNEQGEQTNPHIDFENAEKYGFRHYNLSKYDRTLW